MFERAPQDWSAVHEIFRRAGCEGTIEETDFPAMSAYVYEHDASRKLVSRLNKELREAGAIEVTTSVVPEENWAESWKSFFRAREIGEKFVVAPTWDVPKEIGNRKLIVLDPGQAFGTGDHPTTRMCVRLLEEEVGPGATVADIGTGSGILAIVAKKLGATEVYATEIETSAYHAALENFARNHVEIASWNTENIPDEVPECDVVVSNLVSATIIRMSDQISQIVGDDGVWIFSGVIPQNLADVERAAKTAGFRLCSWERDEGWIAGRFTKASPPAGRMMP